MRTIVSIFPALPLQPDPTYDRPRVLALINALAETVIGLFKTEVIYGTGRGAASRTSKWRRRHGSPSSIRIAFGSRFGMFGQRSLRRSTYETQNTHTAVGVLN